MSQCDTCRAPGHCCKGFALSLAFSASNWRQEAESVMADKKLPFVPVRPIWHPEAEPGDTAVIFDCTKLGPDGRCTIYDSRPALCASYEPGYDGLCVEYVNQFRGIPIVEQKVAPTTVTWTLFGGPLDGQQVHVDASWKDFDVISHATQETVRYRKQTFRRIEGEYVFGITDQRALALEQGRGLELAYFKFPAFSPAHSRSLLRLQRN